jgi:hypothetical protein
MGWAFREECFEIPGGIDADINTKARLELRIMMILTQHHWISKTRIPENQFYLVS